MRLTVPTDATSVYHWDGWTLYELPHKPGDSLLWRYFKVMQPPTAPARWRMRRAFTLTWNPLELRMRKDRERRAIEIENPDLYVRVELFLSLNYGPEWLRDVQGVTDIQVEGERIRLATMARERRSKKRRVTKRRAKRAAKLAEPPGV